LLIFTSQTRSAVQRDAYRRQPASGASGAVTQWWLSPACINVIAPVHQHESAGNAEF